MNASCGLRRRFAGSLFCAAALVGGGRAAEPAPALAVPVRQPAPDRAAPVAPGPAVVAVPSPPPLPAAAPGSPFAIGERTAPARRPRDLFGAYTWDPPAPATRAAAAGPPPPPPPPVAPPLPFTYAGRVIVDERTTYVLVEGLRVHLLEPGGRVGDFRLASVTPAALVFDHAPSGTSTQLPLPR